jgi:subtilisin-like proprotein convertase family protein
MTRVFLRGRKGFALVFAAAALVSIGAAAGTASAATTSFANPARIDIPDSSVASPYPSTLNVIGLAGNVQKVTATLNGFTHTCPADLVVLLAGPSGTNSTLMGGVGGCPGTDIGLINLTFDQAAASELDSTDTALSGTYRPSGSGGSFTPPAPGGTHPLDLNVFNGTPPNGVWQLFIEDQRGGDEGSISGGWSLTLNAPVNTLTAGKPKLNKKKGTAQLPVTVGDAGQLTLSGKGVKTAAASKSVAVAAPGTVNLTVKPKGKTRKKLNSTGKAKVKVNITFTPTGGASNATTKKIKLKKTLG